MLALNAVQTASVYCGLSRRVSRETVPPPPALCQEVTHSRPSAASLRIVRESLNKVLIYSCCDDTIDA
jgi:hypothetical protein